MTTMSVDRTERRGRLPGRARALRMTGALLVTVALVAPASLAPASPTLAATSPTLEVSPDTGALGAELTARGFDFPSGVDVELRWATVGGSVVGEDTTTRSGEFQIPFTIPAEAQPGLVRVFACVVSTAPCPVRAGTVITVVAAGPTPRPTRTPRPTATPTPVVKTPTPTREPVGSPPPSPSGPTVAIPPTPTPDPTVPVPSFPLAGPTPTPSPFSVVAVTPAPAPPDGLVVPEGSFPDLDILAIEVTQGIQNLSNKMPLVANRRTFARVYLDVIGADELPHTWGALEARRNGQQIGWMWPENGPITAIANGGNRLELDDSLYFRLPDAWLNGTVTLTAFVYSHAVTTPFEAEPSAANNFEVETVTFREAEPLELHLATLHLHRSYHPSDVVREYESNLGALSTGGGPNETARILAGLRRYHPISSMSWDLFPVPIQPLDHDDPDEWDLGDCSTVVADPDDGQAGLWIADWRPLMDDPDAEQPLDQAIEPDRATMWVLDRTYTVSHFYIRESGKAQLFFTSATFDGPDPVPGAPAFVDGCPNPNDESGHPNSTLALWRVFYDWADSREFFVGMVHPLARTRWAGLASSKDTAWVRMNPNFSDSVPWHHAGAMTMAHEVGHLAGLKHVACKDDNDDGVPDELVGGAVDPTHPQQQRFPTCSLAEIRDYGYYGFDVYHDLFGLAEPVVISNDPAAPVLNRAYPLLGYKGARWIDPYHYCRLLVYYGVPCDADAIDEPWSPPGGSLPDSYWIPQAPIDVPLPDPGLPLLLVTGLVDPAAGSGTLEGVLSLDDPTPALLERLGDQEVLPDDLIVGRLVTIDSDGEIVSETPVGDRSSAEERGGRFAYDLLVPLDPSITMVELRDGEERTLARLPVSANVPTARWTSLQPGPAGALPEIDDQVVVTFESADADGDGLAATLLYAPDGEHWQVVRTGITGRELPLAGLLDGLPGSDSGTLRLLVTDGVHTTIAADEPSVRVPNGAPTAVIESPATPIALPTGAQVVLAGTGWDAEDRMLAGSSLAWSSSLDGPLGSGPEVRTRELSPGRHTIQLTATDTAGAPATASVEIVVDGDRVQPRPGDGLEATVAGMFQRLGEGGNPAPPAEELAHVVQQDGPVAPLAGIVGLAIAAVVVGAWALRMRMVSGGRTSGGDSSVWIRVSHPPTGTGQTSKDMVMKGSTIDQNGPGSKPAETITIHGQYDLPAAPGDDRPLTG